MPKGREISFPALLVLAGMVGCEASSGENGVGAARDTLANGAERVRYASLFAANPEPTVPELSIGVVEGEPHFIFGDVRAIEAGLDGTIFVLDHQASEVRAFGPDGSFRGRVAGRGQGPGEIMRANGIVRAADGTLWVQDHGQWRLIRLDPEGGEAERIPMFVQQFGFQWDGVVDEAGRIWSRWSRSLAPDSPRPPGSGPVESAIEEGVVFHDPVTGVSDTIVVATQVSRSYMVVLEDGREFRAIPFEVSHLIALDPAGAVWSASGDDYRIVRLNARGDTTRVIEVAHPPARVTAGDREDFLALARDRGPNEEEIAREIVRAMPERKPALSQLVVDDEGRLWVRRYAQNMAEPMHYDVFDRTGDFLGSIRLGFRTPSHFRPRIRDNQFYTLAVDEYDVPSVVRVPVELTGR